MQSLSSGTSASLVSSAALLSFPSFVPSHHGLCSCRAEHLRRHGRKCGFAWHSSSSLRPLSAVLPASFKALLRPQEGRDVRGLEKKENTMRAMSRTELSRLTRTELLALQREIARMLPEFPEGSHELRLAHVTLHDIRLILAGPGFRPR
jgi:hypothetical protein